MIISFLLLAQPTGTQDSSYTSLTESKKVKIRRQVLLPLCSLPIFTTFINLFSMASCLLSGLFSVFSTYIKQNNLLRLCQNNSWPCLNPLIGLFVCLFCFYRLGSQTQRALKVWRPLDGAARLLLWLVRQPGALFQMTHCHPLALALNITLLLEEVVHSHPIQINQPLFYHGILFLNRICNVFNHCFWVCILIAPFSAPECHLWEERGHICLVHCLILSTKKSAQGG